MSLASGQNLPGFGDEPIWLVLLKVLAVFAFLVVMTLFSIVFERKVVGRMQTEQDATERAAARTGPSYRLSTRVLAPRGQLMWKASVRTVSSPSASIRRCL